MSTFNVRLLIFLSVVLLLMWVALYAFAYKTDTSVREFTVDLNTVGINVRDGDTFVITGDIGSAQKSVTVIVRLFGFDAPEKGQICWKKDGMRYDCAGNARTRLMNILSGDTLECVKRGKSYDRIVMQCSVDNVDIGQAMVREGLVYGDTRYSNGIYTKAESEAKAQKLGVWQQDNPEKPWDWRENRKNLR